MDTLTYSIQDGVATLTMNRPEARNALSATMKTEMTEAAQQAATDPSVGAIVLAGAGGVFSGGGDLRGMRESQGTMTVQTGRDRMRELQPLIRTLATLDKPLIAAVDGAAYGAGFSMALMADFVLASPRARFCMSFMRVGLVPDFAAMYFLPRVVGVQRAKELMLSAREVATDEALRLGIVMEVLPSDALMARATALAASFAGASALGLSLIKRGIGMSLARDLDTALADEADHQGMCLNTEEHRAAVRRFLAKEPAAFQFPVAGKG